MLEVKQLTRWYGDFKAVDNVSFNLNKGEIVGLLGHNGAGKTTIMKMLSGFLEANAGEVTFENLTIQNDLKQIQSFIGYLPENLPIYPEMTVVDYLDYAAQLKGLTGEHKISELKRVIAATELADKLSSPISTLSRGYKQRAGVAQAILGNPKLLILDEPTNGLDPTQTEHMRQLIRDIAKNATVILSTHIMQEVEALCDRAIIIRDGQLAVDAQLDSLRKTNSLLMSTSLSHKETEKLLQAINIIQQVELLSADEVEQSTQSNGSGNHFRIHLVDDSDSRQISATVAKLIIQANGELYSLLQEHRDLDTLFKQVNLGLINHQGVKNAA